MSVTRSRGRISAALLALVLAWQAAGAETIAPYPLEEIQGLAQSSNLCATAVFESATTGRRMSKGADGVLVQPIDDVVRIRINRVHFGDKRLEGTSIEFLQNPADPFGQPEGCPRFLVLLRRNGPAYRLAFWAGYGLFVIDDSNRVRAWIEPKEYGAKGYTVSEIVRLARKYRKDVVDLQVAARPPSAAGKAVRLEWTFTNVGSRAVHVAPPSWSIGAVRATRLSNGGGRPAQTSADIGHWRFLGAKEEPALVAKGDSKTFVYDVPREALGMTQPGAYRIDVDYALFNSMWFYEECRKPGDHAKGLWLGLHEQTIPTVWMPE